MPETTQGEFFVYVGTFTKNGKPAGRADGLYIYRMSTGDGALQPLGMAPDVVNPAFLAFAPGFAHLYAVNEIDSYEGKESGAVSAFAVDRAGGGLSFINRQPTLGSGPCHLSVDRTGKWVAVANYRGGSVTLLPILPGGRLGSPATVQHSGSSIDARRQERAHAHSAIFDPSNRFLLVADLGMDKIMIYRLDAARGVLLAHKPPAVEMRPGSGPRHQAFHPNKRFYYVLNELDSTLSVFAYDGATTTFSEIQHISTLPAGFSGVSYCAELQIAPSGRFVYASNRGHDSIAVFSIDEQSGRVSVLGHTSTQGKWPRNFVLAPAGDILLAANEHSDTIVTYHVDQRSGSLTPTGHVTNVPSPVCIRLMPAR